jgi:hypothetical protein
LRGAPREGKPGSFIDCRKYTNPESNWRPSACQAHVLATRPLGPWPLGCQGQGSGINGLTPWHFAREGRGVDVSMHARMDLCDALPPSRPTPKHIPRKSVPLCHEPFCGGSSSAHGATVGHLIADHKVGFSKLPAPMLPPHALHLTAASSRKTRGAFLAIATEPHQQNARQPHQLEHRRFQMQGKATFDAKPSVASPLQRQGLPTMALIA